MVLMTLETLMEAMTLMEESMEKRKEDVRIFVSFLVGLDIPFDYEHHILLIKQEVQDKMEEKELEFPTCVKVKIVADWAFSEGKGIIVMPDTSITFKPIRDFNYEHGNKRDKADEELILAATCTI